MRAKDAVGEYGERLAVRHLLADGFEVLACNWRCREGEIDVVGREGAALVIVEVKTRRHEQYGDPLEAITGPKLARLRGLAAAFARDLAERTGEHAAELRIDAVGIVLPERGAAVVRHLRGLT
mgnify:FL=1